MCKITNNNPWSSFLIWIERIPFRWRVLRWHSSSFQQHLKRSPLKWKDMVVCANCESKGCISPCTTRSQAPLRAAGNPQCLGMWCLCFCLVRPFQRTSFWSCSKGLCRSPPLWETWTPSCSMWSSCKKEKRVYQSAGERSSNRIKTAWDTTYKVWLPTSIKYEWEWIIYLYVQGTGGNTERQPWMSTGPGDWLTLYFSRVAVRASRKWLATIDAQ